MDFINLFPSIDIFILFLFVLAIVLHLVFVKKEKLLVCLLSVYVSFFLLLFLPLLDSVKEFLASFDYLKVGVFVGLTFVLYILFSFSNLASFSRKITTASFTTSLVYRVVITGFFFTVALYFLPGEVRNSFGGLIHVLFINMFAPWVWFLLPLLLAFGYRFKTRRGWME